MRSPSGTAAWALVVCGLVAVNLALLRQNARVTALANDRLRLLEVQPGTKVPPLVGLDLAGRDLTVSLDREGRKTVLLVFSPSCPACDRNWPAWQEILKEADSRSLRFVLLNASPARLTASYLDKWGAARLPVFARVDPADTIAYKLNLTPQTILVAADGRVDRIWSGSLDRRAVDELRDAMGVHAPR